MKNKRFLRAMGEIDDRLLERYEKIEQNLPRKKAYKSVWIKYASLAACLCIIFTSVFLLQRERGFGGDTPAIVGSNSETYTQAGTIGGVNERPTQAGTTSGYIADELPKPPPPIFETKNPDEYENFLRSEECSVNLFSLDIFECFGEFSFFETYNVTSFSNFSATYRYQFDKLDTWIRVGSREVYFNDSDYSNHYGDIYIEDEDMPENLRVDPRTHWFRNSENELVEAAYYQKYNIGLDDRYVHFKVTENVVLRYREWEASPRVIFWFDDYVMELSFGPEYSIMEAYDLVGVTPTVKDLLTKSTAKATAEALYNLWKDALK